MKRLKDSEEVWRIAAAADRPFSVTAKSAGVKLIGILEAIPESERIDALAIAVKVYTEDSEAVQRCRAAVREMNKNSKNN